MVDFVFVDGSYLLLVDWNVGSEWVIICVNVGLNVLFVNKILYVGVDKILVMIFGMYFVLGMEMLVMNLDVLGKILIFVIG